MKKAKPKLSIIIPCLNASQTIGKTLQSLREQNNKNFECIVMDGNSTDSTQEIVQLYKDIVDVFVSENDKSGADAANKGIKISNGDFVIFLYADDYLKENFVDEIISAIRIDKNVDYISYGLQIENLENKKIKLQSYKKKNLLSNIKNACFKHVLNHAYNKNLFNDIGKLKHLYFDNDIFYSNDREFLIRICLHNKRNHVIEKILYIMQNHGDSFTGSRSNIIRIRYEHIGIADYYLDQKNLNEFQARTLMLFKVHNLALLFIWYLITFDLKNCFNIFVRGFKCCKGLWLYYIFSRPLAEIIYRFSVSKLI